MDMLSKDVQSCIVELYWLVGTVKMLNVTTLQQNSDQLRFGDLEAEAR